MTHFQADAIIFMVLNEGHGVEPVKLDRNNKQDGEILMCNLKEKVSSFNGEKTEIIEA